MTNNPERKADRFFEWLATRVSSTQLSDLYETYAYTNAFCHEKRLTYQDLSLYSDPAKIRSIRNSLDSNRLYRFVNRGRTAQISAVLRYYETFLSEHTPHVGEQNTQRKSDTPTRQIAADTPNVSHDTTMPLNGSGVAESHPTAEMFKSFLRKRGINDIVVEKSLEVLQYVEKLAKKRGLSETRLLSTEDPSIASQTYNALMADAVFIEKDSANKGQFSKIVKYYVTMLTGNSPQSTQVAKKDSSSYDIIAILNAAGKRYVDARPNGSSLWVWGYYSDQAFFADCKEKGFEFRYVPNGSRSTRGANAWYLIDSNSESPQAKEDRQPLVDTEVGKLFDGADFIILRDALLKAGVYTLIDLKKIRLWPFMVDNELYPTAKRHPLFLRAKELIKEAEQQQINNAIDDIIDAIGIDEHSSDNDTTKIQNSPINSDEECIELVTTVPENEGDQQVSTQGIYLRDKFNAWMEKCGSSSPTIRSYSSAVSEAGRYAVQNQISSIEIYMMADPYEVTVCLDTLLQNPEFAKKNTEQHNRFSAAIRKYSEFLSDYCQENDPVNNPGGAIVTDTRWEKVLMEQFPDGYVLDDIICQFQAIAKWNELYGEDCVLQGTELDMTIAACGTNRDGRIYVINDSKGEVVIALYLGSHVI